MKKPLREIMLEVNDRRFRDVYRISSSKEIAYNNESTQICVDGKPIFKYLERKLSNPEVLDRLISIRKERRDLLVKAQEESKENPDLLFNLQFDYELLGLDHLVDDKRINHTIKQISCPYERALALKYLAIPPSGRTFYEEIRIKELEVLGNYLRKNCCQDAFFFEGKDFEYFLKHTSTRDKLIRIILENDKVVSRLRKRFNDIPSLYPNFKNPGEVYQEVKEARLDQMRTRATISNFLSKFKDEQRAYLEFVGDALDYNEDNRLLRSVSFFYIMKDPSVPARFYELLEARKNGKG